MCNLLRKDGASVATGNPFRLPRTVTPESYQVRLVPDLAAASFSGEATIKVKVTEPVDEIVLNAVTFEDPDTCQERALQVTEALVRRGNGTAFVGTIVEEPKTERIRIKVNGTIGTGDWQIKLRFTGVLNDKLKGFYRSTYRDSAGTEQVIGCTQFESTDARRAFPCFDEPDMKATFQITLVVDEDLAAISNGRVLSETIVPGSRQSLPENRFRDGDLKVITNEIPGTGKKEIVFAPTMKMSTYIVAFVVGKLVATKPVNVDGVAVRVWCVPGKEHLAPFALQAAQFSLRYFRRYFGVAYPGDKLDLLAIPDFAAGAMENLGCVTFREGALLVDPETASQAALDYVAEVVAHELAHMWFGNLVTMKWWNGLWLNEAFATFMAAKATDAWKREWGVWDKFGLARGTAMRTDGLGSTRPIEFTVNAPDDANAMFDVLTYEKGCSVMRMLEQFMGEDQFRNGIAAYIKAHSYGNTETVDLWNALEAASGLPVGEIMEGWIFRPGYPLISVRQTDGVAGSITISQQGFKFLADAVDHEQRWMVPIMLRTRTADGVSEQKHLLRDKEETIYLGEGVEWVVVNAGGHGFFRVVYSNELRDKLTANLQSTLSVIERVNLVGDAWASVQAGVRRATDFVDLCKLFSDERNPNVWALIDTGLSAIGRLLPESHKVKYAKLVRDLATPAFNSVGWEPKEGESTNDAELRSSLITLLGLTGKDETMHDKAVALFAQWKADRGSVDGNILGPVVVLLSSSDDAALYDEFYSLFKGAQNPEEEDTFQYALARFRSQELVTRTLGYTMNPAVFRTQDAPFVVARLFGNSVGRELAWAFVKANWDKMVKLYPESGMVRLCQGMTALNTPELEAEVKEWFATHTVKQAGKALAQTLELLRVSVLLRQRESDSLLAAYAPDPEPAAGEDAGARPDCVGEPLPGDGAAADATPAIVPEGHGTGVLAPPAELDAGPRQA